MTFSTRMRTGQAQVFRMGHVVNVLHMSGEELNEHLFQTARDNPLLVIRQRPRGEIRAGGAHDLLDTSFADAPSSLYDHVFRELAGLLAPGDPMARLIHGLIEELEPTGWLGRPVRDIAAKLGFGCDLVETAVNMVQRRISPAGLFARNLADCLRLQLQDQELWDDDAEAVITHLDMLLTGGPEALGNAVGLDAETVSEHLARLRCLDPKPGNQFAADLTLLREPDVRIEPHGDGWRSVFKSSFATEVAVLPKAACDSSSELRQALAEARALKQALDLRKNALKHIVQIMVEVQGDYFRDGPEALHPLTQATIAERTGFHLSTVSRVLNGLLIEGPNGIIPARILCPRSSGRAGQSGASKPKVMAHLCALLKAESASCPLSDQRLSEKLGAEGLSVSRRVVAKYRQELGYAPAAQRRLRA